MPSQKSQSEKDAEKKAAQQEEEQKKAQEQNEKTKEQGGDPSDNNATPAEDAAASSNDGDNESVAHQETKKAQESGENYDPYNDPDVPSSAVAEQIARELRSGESRTLDGIREQKKAAESNKK